MDGWVLATVLAVAGIGITAAIPLARVVVLSTIKHPRTTTIITRDLDTGQLHTHERDCEHTADRS